MKSRNFCVFLCIFLAISVVSVQAAPGTVTRTISPSTVLPGGTVTVTLTVDVAPGERFYIIDEIPSTNFTIQNVGELVRDPTDHLKIVTVQGAVDKTYTYTVVAPNTEGSYTFSGVYQMDGMDQGGQISGPSTVTVSLTAGDQTMLIIAVVIIIVVVLAYLYTKKAKIKLSTKKSTSKKPIRR